MRVNFDPQIFCSQTVGGISRYFASLAKEMNEIQGIKPRIIAPYHCNEYLKALSNTLIIGKPAPAIRTAKPIFRATSLFMGKVLQYTHSSDILHRTYYYPFPAPSKHAKNVITVYDMIHEKYPENYSKKDPIARWKKRIVSQADKIICISENTRKDLLEQYDAISPDQVSVTHLGFDALSDLLTDETSAAFRLRTLGVDTPYLLFVGHRSGYKNFTALLQAYSCSAWLRNNFYLLCFGGGKFNEKEAAMIASTGNTARVRQVGGNDSVLASCYRHAAVFVYPSLYEGFGIPPLEAMSMDCPVACSQTSSIPEVVGHAAAFFDPSSADSIRSTLEAVLNSPTLSDDLVNRGKTQKMKYSWRKCAEETVNIYRATLAQ